jgi:hypothetical protein
LPLFSFTVKGENSGREKQVQIGHEAVNRLFGVDQEEGSTQYHYSQAKRHQAGASEALVQNAEFLEDRGTVLSNW